jgi:hypothetical protein
VFFLKVLWPTLLVITSLVQGRATAWPIIQPFTVRFPVHLTSTKIAIDRPLKTSTGARFITSRVAAEGVGGVPSAVEIQRRLG